VASSPASTTAVCARPKRKPCGWPTANCRTRAGDTSASPNHGPSPIDAGPTAAAHTARGLKHRAASGIRRLPIPPELVEILRDHVAEFGTADDGRLFQTRRGGIIGSNYAVIWSAARPLALTPAQVVTPIAGRPHDLRHAAVSLWLNAGVPATEVAARAGHGVDVLLRVYATCIDGSEPIANARIDTALEG
jgi:integrase